MSEALVDDLSAALNIVGFRRDQDDALLTKELSAKSWTSSYARVYVADVSREPAPDWPSLLDEIDRTVLTALRTDELKNGGVLDAHVCFIVDDFSGRGIAMQLDERRIRNVSRKYWIERREGFAGLQSRLSLLGMAHLSVLTSDSSFGISAADQEWVDMLVQDGPAPVFQRFMKNVGC
jgi:hypothetical protein